MDHTKSALVPWSIGTVAANKSIDSRDIQVTLRELSGFMDGIMADNIDNLETTTQTKDGTTEINQTQTSTVITATWLPYNTNRVTAPDVRKGERVIVYRLENTQRYFWTPMGLDDKYRKLETVIYAFSANPDISVHELSIEKCYFFEISGHNKTTTFSTSQANGEVTKFLVQFDGAKGTITVKDSHGQEVFISALDRVIQAVNGDGTKVLLDRTEATIDAPTVVYVNAGTDMHLKALQNFTTNANNVTITGKTSTVVKGGGASTLTLVASGTTLTTPKFTGG